MTMTMDVREAAKEPVLRVRTAEPDDAQEVLDIYRHYVENTAVTFECIAPTLDEMRGRIEKALERYPYLVAERDGRIVGFASAGPFKTRHAYDWSVETTVYVSAAERGAGVGAALYEALEEALQQMGVLNLYACVACPDVEDEYLTDASFRFHERRGFSKIGEFRHCGNKFGRWYSMTWMGKTIGSHEPDPAPIRPFAA